MSKETEELFRELVHNDFLINQGTILFVTFTQSFCKICFPQRYKQRYKIDWACHSEDAKLLKAPEHFYIPGCFEKSESQKDDTTGSYRGLLEDFSSIFTNI